MFCVVFLFNCSASAVDKSSLETNGPNVASLDQSAILDVPVKEEKISTQSSRSKHLEFAEHICKFIKDAAIKHRLPAHFLTRLIWQESRFNPKAVSPKGARGIAQFMQQTAVRWGLDDPYDPQKAIFKSAQYLAFLQQELGNLGLAAAGYNAGENRVSRWLLSKTYIPRETRNYVYAITGRNVSDWKDPSVRFAIPPILKGKTFKPACIELASRKKRIYRQPERSSPPRRWGVNIAQRNTKKAALHAFKKMQRRFPKLLANKKTRIINLRLARQRRWTMTIIQVPAKSRSKALSFCRKVWNRGGFCLARAY